jgi:hypothetical protein
VPEEFEGERQLPPYEVKVSYTARVALSSLAEGPGEVAARLFEVLSYEPEQLCKTPQFPGGQEYSIGITDCPGGPLAIRLSFDKHRHKVIVLDLIHPAPAVPIS